MIGRTVSQYLILEKIGAGGMGEVFLAEDPALGRRLALKILPEDFTRDPDRVRRFEQEARAASALNHPNIITIYQIGRYEGFQFIATEYIQGRTLRQEMRDRRLSLRESVEIALQCANGLQAAHNEGIIHRDIKPENIMIRPDGYIKLLDFGLAKLTEISTTSQIGPADEDGPTQSLVETQPGMVIGTVAYMSPEQARGQKVDSRTDIFSLGIVLYEMLAGRKPFQGETPSDMIASLLVGVPPRLSEYLPGIPADLEALVSGMLAKDLNSRYQTIQEVFNELKRLRVRLEMAEESVGGQSVEDAATSPLAAVQPRIPTRDMPAGESFATNLSPAAGASLDSYETSLSPSPPAATEVIRAGATEKVGPATGGLGSRRLLLPAVIVALAVLAAGAYALFRLNGESKIDTVAILPFISAAQDDQTQYLGDGIAEEIINSLAQLPGLSVTSRNAVIRYRGREADAQAVGRELGVKAVLIGRILRRDDNLTINTELVRVSDGRQIWGERFIRKMADLIAIQDEITWKITDRLKYRLSESQKRELASLGTRSSEAYELYLKGRYFWNQGTLESMKTADRYFEAAAAKDPEYALAAAGCAACHAAGTDEVTPKQAMEKARLVAQAALSIDDTIVDAHLTLANVKLRYDWDYNAAEREIRRAIDLDPRNPSAHQKYAEFLSFMGRFDDAVREAGRARDLDPQSIAVNQTLGTLAYYERRFDMAIDRYQQVLKLDGGYAPAYARLGQVYDLRGDTRNAVSALIKSEKLSGQEPVISKLEEAFKAQGRDGFWRDYLRYLQSESANRYVPSSRMATIHLRLGERDLAFDALDRAFAEKEGGIVELKVDPVYEPLRQAPRFQEMLRRAGLE